MDAFNGDFDPTTMYRLAVETYELASCLVVQASFGLFQMVKSGKGLRPVIRSLSATSQVGFMIVVLHT